MWFQKNYPDIKPIEELHEELYKFWLTVHKHNKGAISLNKAKEYFFNKSVERVYDHDSIHEAIKYTDVPMFKNVLKNGSDVLTDKAKFDALPYDHKLYLAREEIFVIALERFLIPKDFKMPYKSACFEATKKLVTTMSKGWFPRFIMQNLLQLSEDYDSIYVNKFNKYFGTNHVIRP